MPAYNKVVLCGNLARDPELRYTGTQKPVASLSLAVNRGKDKNGDSYGCDFIPIVVWGNVAENCERYLHKGDPILVDGTMKIRKYEDKEGNNRYVTEVVAHSVVFLSSGKNKGGGETSSYSPKIDEGEFPLDYSEMEGSGDSGGWDDEEIPF